jgi:hypothetical protein
MITMEKITFLTGKDTYDKQYKFMLDQNVEYQKLRFYQGSLYSFSYATKKETDTHIYWSVSGKKPMLENDKLFFKHENLQGASYEKRTKKIKIWFGKKFNTMDAMLSTDILNTLVPWYLHVHDANVITGSHNNYLNIMTNEILNKMVKGTIKDTKGIVDAFCKYNPYRKFNLDTAKIDYIMSNSQAYFNIRSFKIALSIGQTIDINWTNEELNDHRIAMLDCRKELERIHNGILGIESNEVNDLPF